MLSKEFLNVVQGLKDLNDKYNSYSLFCNRNDTIKDINKKKNVC